MYIKFFSMSLIKQLRKSTNIHMNDLMHSVQSSFFQSNFVVFWLPDLISIVLRYFRLGHFTHSSFVRSVCERDPETSFKRSIIGNDYGRP